jgi:hypothetical protein
MKGSEIRDKVDEELSSECKCVDGGNFLVARARVVAFDKSSRVSALCDQPVVEAFLRFCRFAE